MNKEISLNDDKFFDIFIGKRILKSEIFNSTGDIPTYSANVFTPFGFLSKSNINGFSKNYLLWGIDGKFEFNSIKKGIKFATTDHCGAIKILDENILPEYLLYKLELQSHILGYDRTLRPSLTMMRKVSINIPLKKDGSFDKEEQDRILKKYISLKNIKNDLKNQIEELSNINLSIAIPDKETRVLEIGGIFDLKKSTNNSKFTKSFVNENKGEVPVYSASKNSDEISYGFVKGTLEDIQYFKDILTWNIDGSVGKAFFREGKFTLSEKVIPLILKEEWENLIDVIYVKYILENKAVEKGFAFTNKAGKSRIRDIKIEVPLKDGEPDIKKQKLLAERYSQLYEIKEKLIQNLQGLQEVTIDIK